MSRLTRFQAKIAPYLFNLLFLLMALNFAAWGYLGLKANRWRLVKKHGHLYSHFNDDGSPVPNGKIQEFLLDWFDYSAMTEVPEDRAYEMIGEFSTFTKLPPAYLPWVQFAEAQYHGKYVTSVPDALGFPYRAGPPPPADPAKRTVTIFAMGGSTTFGYQAGAAETWPAYLSEILNHRAEENQQGVQVRVVNYGHCFYYTSTELALTIHYLKNGLRPDLLIYLDGVNEVSDAEGEAPPRSSAFNTGLRLMQDETLTGDLLRFGYFAANLPLTKLLQPKRPGLFESKTPKAASEAEESRHLDELAGRALARYHYNTRLIQDAASLVGARAMFVIQPDSLNNYPLTLFRRAPTDSFLAEKKKHERFHALVRKEPQVTYLGDLFREWGVNRKAIVDDAHYSPAFNRFLAEKIAERIDLDRLTSSPPARKLARHDG